MTMTALGTNPKCRNVRYAAAVGDKRTLGGQRVSVAIDPLLTSVRHVFEPQQSPLARSSDMFGRSQKG